MTIAKAGKHSTSAPNANKQPLRVTLYNQRYIFLMLTPALILAALFIYRPFIYLWVAFTHYRLGFPVFSGTWNNFASFRAFFADTMDGWDVIRNTLQMNITTLFVNLLSAMVFAILLNEVRIKFAKSLVQVFTLFPFFVSWVITYSLFNAIFAVNTGLLNNFLLRHGIISQGINILGEARFAVPLIVFANFWKALGYLTILFLAAIAGIDQEQYESADMDGASRLQKMWYITAPSLLPTLGVLFVLFSGSIFNSNFEQFFMFTNPTNRPRMLVFDMYIFEQGLRMGRISYATAAGLVRSFMALGTLLLVNLINKKLSGNSVF